MNKPEAQELLGQFVEWLNDREWASAIPTNAVERFLEDAEAQDEPPLEYNQMDRSCDMYYGMGT